LLGGGLGDLIGLLGRALLRLLLGSLLRRLGFRFGLGRSLDAGVAFGFGGDIRFRSRFLGLLIRLPHHVAVGSLHELPHRGVNTRVRLTSVLLVGRDFVVLAADLEVLGVFEHRRSGVICGVGDELLRVLHRLPLNDENEVPPAKVTLFGVLLPLAGVGDDRDAVVAGVEIGKRDDRGVLLLGECLGLCLAGNEIIGELLFAFLALGELLKLVYDGPTKDFVKEPIVGVLALPVVFGKCRERNRDTALHELRHLAVFC